MSRIVIHLYIFFVENIRHSANKSPDNSTTQMLLLKLF